MPDSGTPETAWQFWIDRGGTFTDCIGVAPDGRLHTAKRLSSDTAPLEAIREIWRAAGVADTPACSVRLGTTVATNALLERRGVPTLFATNRGLGDLLAIGTQERPELFAHRLPALGAELVGHRVEERAERVRRAEGHPVHQCHRAGRDPGPRRVGRYRPERHGSSLRGRADRARPGVSRSGPLRHHS